MKRINVITTTYNDAHKYLIETIESVKKQEFNKSKIEIFHTLVDDGSTNKESLRYLEKINKKYGLDIISQENMGLAGARNTAINSIESDYILPLDADDIIDPLFVDNLHSCFKERKYENSLIYTNWKSFGKYSRNLFVKKPTPYTIRYANYLPVCTLIPTPKILKEKYDKNLNYGFEDWDLWIRLICQEIDLCHISYFGFYHREQTNNLTTKALKNYKKVCKFFRNKYKELYTEDYNRYVRKKFPPDLYDLFRCNTDPRIRFALIKTLSLRKFFDN